MIPIRGLKLAHDLCQPCAIRVSKFGVSFFDLLYYDRPRSASSNHPELYQGYQRFMESTAWPAAGRGVALGVKVKVVLAPPCIFH